MDILIVMIFQKSLNYYSICSNSAIKDAVFPKDVFGETPMANPLFYVQWSQRCYFSQMR